MAKPTQTKPAKVFILNMSEVGPISGEKFGGLNILKLQPGQAAAGLRISRIGTQKVKGRGKEKGKTREIPSYAAVAPDGLEYRLPLNKSFVEKAEKDAKLAVGDEITLVCEGAYTSNEGNKGIGFSIYVTARAKGSK